MAVLEVGLIFDNQLIYSFSFAPVMEEKDLSKSSFLASLQTFTSKTFGEQTEEIKFNKYRINIRSFQPNHLNNADVFLFVISDNERNLRSTVNKKLKRVVETIKGLRIIKEQPSPGEKKFIETIILNHFADLGKKSEERFRSLF